MRSLSGNSITVTPSKKKLPCIKDAELASHSSVIVDESHDRSVTFVSIFTTWKKHRSLDNVLPTREINVRFGGSVIIVRQGIIRREISTHHRHDCREIGAKGWVHDVEEKMAMLAAWYAGRWCISGGLQTWSPGSVLSLRHLATRRSRSASKVAGRPQLCLSRLRRHCRYVPGPHLGRGTTKEDRLLRLDSNTTCNLVIASHLLACSPFCHKFA